MATLTPILDKELVKLRRKLGDIYDSSGNAIVYDTPPGAGNIYVGDVALISTWNAGELLDCYNDAIRIFIDYCLKFLSPKAMAEYLVGYLIILPNQTATSVVIGSVTYYYVDIDALTPKLYRLISSKDTNDTKETSLGAYVPPEEFFGSRIYRSRDSQLLWTQTYVAGAVNKNSILFLNLDSDYKVDLMYVKQHTDLVHNNASPGDLSGISSHGLRRVSLIAETIAQRYRSVEVRDIADSELNQIMQTDMVSLAKEK